MFNSLLFLLSNRLVLLCLLLLLLFDSVKKNPQLLGGLLSLAGLERGAEQLQTELL